MIDDFAPIEALAGSLLRQLGASERRKLLRRMAREIQKTQSARIGRQQDPEGGAFAARKPKRELKPGAYAAKFLYPRVRSSPAWCS